jgi:integrase
LVAIDPTAGIKPRVKTKARDRVLTADEIRTLWAKLDNTPMGKRLATVIRLALVTGQRIGEVSGIAKSEIDLATDKPMWTLPGKRSKNTEGHRIPLSGMAVTLIEGAMRASGDSPSLFPDASGQKPIAASAASKAMWWVRPSLGIEGWRIHDLRRTVASYMAELGVSKHTVSLILNHVSAVDKTVTDKVYIKYSFDREKRAALELWASHLERILAGQAEQAADNVVEMKQRA